MGAGQPRERVEDDDDVASQLDLPAGVLEHHVRGGHVPLVRQVEARGDHFPPPPVDHLADFFRPLVHEQDQQNRFGVILGHRLRDRLQHHRFPGFGRRDDQRPLAEAEGADEIDDALRLRGAGTRCLGRLERQRTVWMDSAQIREIGAPVELASRLTVHRRHATIVEDDQIPAAQTGQANGGIAFRGQITVGGEPKRAAFLRRIKPTGHGRHLGRLTKATRYI